MNAHLNPNVRHDALLVFEAIDSNPNGDPDNAGAPRVDDETGQGLVTDASIKRKVRDIVARLVAEGDAPAARNSILITAGTALNATFEAAYADLGHKPNGDKNTAEEVNAGRDYMRENFFDVRMFGAVMSTGKASCGRVTGPVTVGIGRSLDPVNPIDIAITRVASTQVGKEDNASQMGNKTIVPYGLYTVRVGYQPTKGNAVTEADLALFWTVLGQAFDATKSAARPDVNVRGLYVFSHSTSLGNAPARTLLEHIQIAKKDGIEVPRHYGDYEVMLPTQADMPSGVTFTSLA